MKKKKSNNVLRASALAGLCLLSAPVMAHHGDAGRYDESAFVVTGTIVEIRLTNPHSIMVFDVTDAAGKTVRWQGEMTGGQQIVRQFGWTKDSPKVGDKITLTGRRVKSGAPYMNLAKRANIVLTDSGKQIYVGQTPPGSPITPEP
jgi:Family of unknown function (DUF6152)